MDHVASRDLRNHTADVLRRVGAGGVVAVTVRGDVVAEIHPPSRSQPTSWTRADLQAWLPSAQADPGLAADLQALAGETTGDLGDP